MKDSKPSLYLFFIASILVILARIFDFEKVDWLLKPTIIPAILYYYLQTKTSKTNYLLLLVFLFFFIGDMIILMFPNGKLDWVLLSFAFGYVLLLYTVIKDFRFVKFKKIIILYTLIIAFFLLLLLNEILDLPVEEIINNHITFLVYGILLIIIATISIFNYLVNPNINSLNLFSMSLCFLISDLFYCFDKFVFSSFLFDIFNLATQFLSYFFMVKFFTTRSSLSINSIYIKNG